MVLLALALANVEVHVRLIRNSEIAFPQIGELARPEAELNRSGLGVASKVKVLINEAENLLSESPGRWNYFPSVEVLGGYREMVCGCEFCRDIWGNGGAVFLDGQ